MTELNWKWYAGDSEEHFDWGPYDSREAAIECAVDDGCGEFQDDDGVWKLFIHLIEAVNDPLKLSDHFHLESWYDDLDNGVLYELGDHDNNESVPIGSTPEQDAELEREIKATIDAWQERHKIVVQPWGFQNSRNSEYIVVDRPTPEERGE